MFGISLTMIAGIVVGFVGSGGTILYLGRKGF